jgi:hypothetical protein
MSARFVYKPKRYTRRGSMKTNGKFQKDAMTTDQKFRNEDEHLHELDKRHLKESAEDPGPVPQPRKKSPPRKD